jgi:hypothetical protein
MNTIATLLDPEKLAELREIAGAATVTDVPDLVDAACELCGVDVKIALPIVGTIACIDCAKARTLGKPGRRYVKTNHKPRTVASPQELARVNEVDLSTYSDGELGRLVRDGLLGVKVAQMQAATAEPDLTLEQGRKVAALMQTLSWTRQHAVAFVVKGMSK